MQPTTDQGKRCVTAAVQRAGGAAAARLAVVITIVAAGLAAGASDAQTSAGVPIDHPVTRRISKTAAGHEANGQSFSSVVSADCKTVAFGSYASNLVKGDTSTYVDAFLRERGKKRVHLVSRPMTGQRAVGDSYPGAISADGRYVAYESSADNLTGSDANVTSDIFVRDLTKPRSRLISVATGGGSGNSSSVRPTMSADGRFVAWESGATDLVADDTNGRVDVFVRDRVSRTTERVSMALGGAESDGDSSSAAISASGRYVTFRSDATNLVDGDGNGLDDVFRYDRKTGAVALVSTTPGGAASGGASTQSAISADGRFVAFTSAASDLVADDTNQLNDVFLRDMVAGTTQRVSISSAGAEGDGDSAVSSVSRNGGVVAFQGFATNLVKGDRNLGYDVFIREVSTNKTTLVSVSTTGKHGNDSSAEADMTPSAGCVSFSTGASNLVPHDTNDVTDVLLRRLMPRRP